MGLVIWLILSFNIIALSIFFIFKDLNETRSIQIISTITMCLAIWSFCTSWLWFYYFNLVLSLPVFLLGILFNTWLTYKKIAQKIVKINWIIFSATILLAAYSYYFFDI
ncbi:hypothetical protein [Chondrinema litorale]|uniref:hypothetical protein n=1 Tax=Chondrinema litorale TaxID=2994555 RepID=UPI0025427296|nr:hypothetical protein [Chondrinema litorale]UZR97707.1 hypothetical protein OQ292_28290 [Chondrinema litorale]